MNDGYRSTAATRRGLRVWAGLIVLAAFLAACGGGGGTREFDKQSPDNGDGVPVSTGRVALSVVDVDSGATKNAISSTTQSVARAVVTDGDGAPVRNAVVKFESSDKDAVLFSPAATALTDETGTASVGLRPATLSTSGAYTLTASTVVGAPVSATYNIAIGATQIELGTLSAEQSLLSAYGTTVFSVPIQGVPASIPVTVRFTSTCASQEPARATITPLTTSVGGVARATYVDKGCGQTDLVTATIDGSSVQQTASVVVQKPKAANIQFVSASPRVIALRGTGGVQGPGTGVPFPEVSTVRFQLVDQAGAPYPVPTNVTLRLSNDTGGLLLDGVSGPLVKQTDAYGYVQVTVQSGTIPTPLWVIATAGSGADTVVTNSVQLAVSTGQPIQSRFSMSPMYHNLEGWSYEESVIVRVDAGDSMGNPVPDGTPISFIAERGLIGANCQMGVDQPTRPLPGPGDQLPYAPGWCAVEFRAIGERPANGRFRVAAYAVGEEHYDDVNSNNLYDVGEPFHDQGYLFLDTNENGSYQAGERIIPYLTSQSGACGGNPLTSSVPNTCDGAWGRAHVRQQATFVLSGSFANFRTSPSFATPNGNNIPLTYQLGATCRTQIAFWLQDLNGNPMPYGTTVKIDISAAQDLKLVPAEEQLVGSTNAVGGTFHSFIIVGTVEGGVCKGGGPVLIRATTPKKNVTDLFVTVEL